ncbi:MAG TPA: hypothetical protein VMV06_07455 [Acidimicrobiales bacterium]|nr:hypothetical protein [Acidimicrobiales bacterium]
MTVGITELPPEGMQLGGVSLAGDADRGTRTTDGLSLLFTTAGITVQGPQPQIERLLVWSGLDTATCGEKIVMPDGRVAAVMELTSGGQSIRFLLPTETVTPGQAAYLDQALPAWLARYHGVAVRPSAPTPAEPGHAPAEAARAAAERVEVEQAADPAPPPAGPGTAPGVIGPQRSPLATEPPPPPPRRPAPASPVSGAAPVGAASGAAPAAPASATPSAASFALPAHPAPPPPPASGAVGFAPPPSNAPPPPTPGVGSSGASLWGAAADPVAGVTAWDAQPSGELQGGAVEAPPKSGRAWRRRRPPEDSPFLAPGAAPPEPMSPPPVDAPVDPVPLRMSPAPPPPPPSIGPEAPALQGPPVWRPPVDPASGETQWDLAGVPGGPDQSAGDGAEKGGGRRKRAKRAAASAAAAGTVGAALDHPVPDTPVAARTPDAGGIAAGPAPAGPAPAGPAPAAATQVAPAGPAPAAVTQVAPDLVGAPAATPAGGDWFFVPGADPSGGSSPPVGPQEDAGSEDPEHKGDSRISPTVIVLSLVLLLVIGGIVYVGFVKKDNAPTRVTSPPTSVASRVAIDTALAASINLRLSDLPAGWGTSTGAGQVARPPVAPAGAMVRANQLLASCVGVDYPAVAGLFGGSVVPGQTASVASPKFQSGSDPNLQMYSVTSVMGTAAAAQALAVPFANPDFVNCYAGYQTALVTAAVPGATATVQAVTLAAPTGVKTYGYLTQVSIPNRPSQVIGQAFMIGGRIESRLEPTTDGPTVPSGAFTPAYDAMSGRIASALGR